jgi:hypothetical protein
MNADPITTGVTTEPTGVGGAVGVSGAKWFVAIVKHNTEKAVGEKLTKMGYETYVPIQTEYKVWRNGRKAKVDRVVIPSVVFIRCTERERRVVVSSPFVNRFMTNKAGTSEPAGNKPLAIIPDHQIAKLSFILCNSDTPVEFSSRIYRKGDIVRVIRGNLRGLEGEVHSIDDKNSELIISLDCLGNARLVIETINVEPVG